MIELLFQPSPRRGNKFDLPSFTTSRMSYDKAAKHEAVVLLLNGRVPDYNIRLNYRVEMPAKQIADLWEKHSDRLKRAGIIARVAIEITKDRWRRRAENRVHYHIAVQDTRTPDELRAIVRSVCRCEMKSGSFRVTCKPITDWANKDVWYFVKYKKWSNYLFRPHLPLQKFYTINRTKWWTNKDGTPRTKGSIEKQMQQYAAAKRHLKEMERSFEIKLQPAGKPEPTDYARLEAELGKQSDETLYDWLATLLGTPTVFQTIPPPWLLNTLHSQPQKRFELFKALYARLRKTKNPLIVFAFEIYFDCELE